MSGPRRTRRWGAGRGALAALLCASAGLGVAARVRAGFAQSAGAAAADATGAGANDAAVERDFAAAQDEVERLTAQGEGLAREEPGLAPRREALTARARQQLAWLYHLSQGEALATQGGPEALLDAAARRGRVREAVGQTLREIDAVTERATQVRVERGHVAELLAQAVARRDMLAAERARRSAVAQGLVLPVTNAGLAEGGALAAQGVGPGGATVTVYGGGVAAADDAPSFEDAAGRLLFPVAGRAEVRRTQREGAEGPGVEVLAPMGAPVRAVFPGRVAFADRYGPLGRIVILDHGEHYYTVSGNLGSLDVRVGQEVSTGAVLGTVGDEGRGPMLYFEVRRGADTIDPAPWLGL